jgi:hypothetical protein
MDPLTREDVRRAIGNRRRAPGTCGRRIVRPDGTWVDDQRREGMPPSEIWLEVGCGRCPPEWLTREARHWSDQPILLGIAAPWDHPLEDTTIDVLSRVRSVAPAWRVVLHIDGRGLASTPMIHRVLAGPFDEVWLSTRRAEGRDDGRGERVLAAIKELIELRGARNQDRPSVTWLYGSGRASEPDAEEVQTARTTARQIGVDRFEVVRTPRPDRAS